MHISKHMPCVIVAFSTYFRLVPSPDRVLQLERDLSQVMTIAACKLSRWFLKKMQIGSCFSYKELNID